MVAFLKDPAGAPLWEENPEAKDVVHIETEKVRIAFRISVRQRSAFCFSIYQVWELHTEQKPVAERSATEEPAHSSVSRG